MRYFILKYTMGFILLISNSAFATTLNISNVPLYLGGSIEPNIMFTLDDSGSMQWEVMPDENRNFSSYVFPRPGNLYGGVTYANQIANFDDDNVHNFFTRSSANNAVFYNPDVNYVPWSNADGTSMGNANVNNALYNPAIPALGGIDLVNQQTQFACWFRNTSDLTQAFGDPCNGNHSFWPITYYKYNGGSRTSRSNYTRVQITTSTSSSTTFTSPSGIVRTKAEEIQNFANWFQYYRSRVLTARAGVGRAFAKQGSNLRVGFAAINQGSKTIDGVTSNRAVIEGLRQFSGSNRTDFFDNLYERVINNSGTPLRSATNSVGQYFERTDNSGPWGNTPGTNNDAEHLSCRQSYHILTTDGYWNGANPGVGNTDGTSGEVISGPDNDDYQYTPANPYTDAWDNTLADVAMEYWKRDLREDLTNNVPTNQEDPAFWQHLVNFTVGLGVNGTLNPDTDFEALESGSIGWPEPSADAEENIDDLWHAAVNSRGSFFSATDPDTFADSLAAILSNISSRTSSAASVALNSGSVSSDSKIYQARFDSGDWSGQLLAFSINDDATLGGVAWDAGTLIPAANDRVIATYDGNSGQPFRWASISASQQTLLGSQSILNYIRGDQSNEASNEGGTLRNRNRLLGDIINSAPTFAAAPGSRYQDNWGNSQPETANPYSAYVVANINRQGLVFVGANDGMLHAFDADTGVEKFAYVPNAIYNNLNNLTNTSYTHKYFVDGSPTIVDAFISGSWRTVLVSGLGAGGQGIFALDITDPTSLNTEANVANKVLWEFTDQDDRDLGFTFGQASIVRLNNGEWAALVGGGYNNTADNNLDNNDAQDSQTGNGVIYLINLADGSLIKKFDTLVGTNDDPTGAERPNGIASPTAIDINNDNIVDAIYAGDLFGNVWSINVTGQDEDNWDFTYLDSDNPEPLYTACAGETCSGANIQPITTRIQVVKHPRENGYLLLFGTGKYFEVGDNSNENQVTQSFYSIWDKRLSELIAFDRSDLLQQQILQQVSVDGFNYRITSDELINWTEHSGWYIDLVNQDINSDNFGERQVSNAIIRNGRVIFTTLIPSDDPCAFGGSGWLMEMNYATGARLSYSPFDVNGDGVFTSEDFFMIDTDGDGDPDTEVPYSGKESKVGIIPTPSIVNQPGGQQEIKYTSGADGNIEVTIENPGPGYEGRQSWRQLQ